MPLNQYSNRKFVGRFAFDQAACNLCSTPLAADDCFGALSKLCSLRHCLPCCFAQRSDGMLVVLYDHDSLPLTELHAPLHIMLTKSLQLTLPLPDLQSKMLDTVTSSTVVSLSYSSPRDPQVSAGCLDCIPLLPAVQIQAGTLVARFTSLYQTIQAVTLRSSSSSPFLAHHDLSCSTCSAALTLCHRLNKCTNTGGNMSCLALRSSCSASDGFPFGCLDQLFLDVQQLHGTRSWCMVSPLCLISSGAFRYCPCCTTTCCLPFRPKTLLPASRRCYAPPTLSGSHLFLRCTSKLPRRPPCWLVSVAFDRHDLETARHDIPIGHRSCLLFE